MIADGGVVSTAFRPHATGAAANHLVDCPVCARAVGRWREKSTALGTFQIDRCDACGFAFVNPRPTLRFLMDFYRSGSDGHSEGEAPSLQAVLAQEARFPNSTLDAARMVRTIGGLLGRGSTEVAPTLLDVGSGYGFFSREAADRGFHVCALEADDKSSQVFAEMLGFEPTPVFFEQYQREGPPFDAILMSQVLEHVLDVRQWLVKARGLLRDGGVLAIALPNFGSAFRRLLQEREPYITPPAHLNYFDANNLSRLLSATGFDVRIVQWVTRIPPTAFGRRLPPFARPIAPLLSGAATLACGAMDRLRLGQIVNVYATALPGAPS